MSVVVVVRGRSCPSPSSAPSPAAESSELRTGRPADWRGGGVEVERRENVRAENGDKEHIPVHI